ncbi:aldo/keto reductase [Rhodococcus sp. IEGM 1381]|uniref:aldo/keto reductase n=1 Tax=Rhodococcus sp. IEGM 1381 TaxID=3047085 RepID=UPI0024B72ED7|nr:aldo/keto reductase [Rhodococcus sp. IEGM 1381]MDI9897402.1 aldo/keto reductase [Rhodococcus sp. IEGM 1381]
MSEHQGVPLIQLGSNVTIPQLGFGVFQVPPDATADVATDALNIGYRHIDTAAGYRNEPGVGEALRRVGLDREDVFITTKCFNDSHGYEPAKRALDVSLSQLGVDYVDLYLIHWPVPSRDLYVDTWRALIDMQRSGLTRAIGVANFQPRHLDRLLFETGVTPAINQVELHPLFTQTGLREKHRDLGVVTEAWSPLARGQVLNHPTLREIAESYGRTPSQIVIRWHLQLGNVVIPKSDKTARLRENFDVFDFELVSDDIRRISSLDTGLRIGPDPDTLVDPRKPR